LNCGLREVKGPHPTKIHYVGANGPIQTPLPRWIAMIPTPWKLTEMFPGASVACDDDVLHYKFYKKKRRIEIDYKVTENHYSATQVDDMLKTDATAYWIETTEVFKSSEVKMYIPLVPRYIPALPPYREVGMSRVSYDNKYVYDIKLNMTYYGRRSHLGKIAEVLGLEVCPVSKAGLIPVDWDVVNLDAFVGRASVNILLVPSAYRPIQSWVLPDEHVDEILVGKPMCAAFLQGYFHGVFLPMISTGTMVYCHTAHVGTRVVAVMPDLAYDWAVVFASQTEIQDRLEWLMEMAMSSRMTISVSGGKVTASDDKRLTLIKDTLIDFGRPMGLDELQEETGIVQQTINYLAQGDRSLYFAESMPPRYYVEGEKKRKIRHLMRFHRIEGFEMNDQRHQILWDALHDARTVNLHVVQGYVDYQMFSKALGRNSIIVSPPRYLQAMMEFFQITNLRSSVFVVREIRWNEDE